MFKKYHLFLLTALFISVSSCRQQSSIIIENQISPVSYVDPFIGTGGHGHTYPGATVPFGMVQVSPVNGTIGWDWCSGYHYSDDVAIGFGHLHLSGTGIGDLSDLLFMPISKTVDLTAQPIQRDSLTYKSTYSHDNEVSKPGFYQVYLKDHKVNVELTASERTAFHKYTFEKEALQSLVIDLGFAINWDKATQTSLKLEDSYTISGYRHSTGWAHNQKVFFVARFNKPIISQQLFSDGRRILPSFVSGEKVSGQFFLILKKMISC